MKCEREVFTSWLLLWTQLRPILMLSTALSGYNVSIPLNYQKRPTWYLILIYLTSHFVFHPYISSIFIVIFICGPHVSTVNSSYPSLPDYYAPPSTLFPFPIPSIIFRYVSLCTRNISAKHYPDDVASCKYHLKWQFDGM